MVELEQGAGGFVDHDRVAVAAGVLPALDEDVGTERVGARVALARVLEAEPDPAMSIGDDVERQAVRVAAKIRPEIRVQIGVRRVHAPHPRGAVGVHRQSRDVGVPHVAGWKHRAVRCTGDHGSCGRARGDRAGRTAGGRQRGGRPGRGCPDPEAGRGRWPGRCAACDQRGRGQSHPHQPRRTVATQIPHRHHPVTADGTGHAGPGGHTKRSGMS